MDKTTTIARVKIITVIVVILLFGIFLGKNFNTVSIWFFGWDLELPLVVIALICFVIGFICGWLINIFYRNKRLEE